MMNTTILLLFFVAMMRSILVSFNHYHVDEKLRNFRVLLKGARPYPNYWFVVALDLVSMVLFSVVVFAFLRYRYIVSDRTRYFNFLPLFLLSGGMYLLFSSLVSQSMLRFHKWKKVIGWIFLSLFTGGILIGSFVLSAAVLQMGTLTQGLALMGVLQGQAWIGPALLLGILLLVLFGLSTFLRVIPVVGDFMMALTQEGIVLLAYQQFSRLLMRPISYLPASLFEVCLCNLRTYYLGLSILAVFLFLLITMLSDRKENDSRKIPPSLVIEQEHIPHPILTSNAETAVLQGQKIRIIVHKQPFEIEIKQDDRQVVKLNGGCISQQLMVSRRTSVPGFYSDIPLHFFWRGKKGKQAVAQQLHVSENRLQIDFEQGLQMLIFLFQEDVIQFELNDKGGRNPEFRGMTFEFPKKATEHLMRPDLFLDETNLIDTKTGALVEVGWIENLTWRGWFSRVGSLLKESREFAKSRAFPVPFFLVKRETGEVFGIFNETYAPCWLDSRGEESIQISQAGNQMKLFLCVGPGSESVMRQFSQLSTWSQLLASFADCLQDTHSTQDVQINETSSECFPYIPIRSELFRSGIKNEGLVKNHLGLPYLQQTRWGLVGLADFTNAESDQWCSKIIQKTICCETGQDALNRYWVSIPQGAVFHNGLDASVMQNAYPVMALECARVSIQKNKEEMKKS